MRVVVTLGGNQGANSVYLIYVLNLQQIIKLSIWPKRASSAGSTELLIIFFIYTDISLRYS